MRLAEAEAEAEVAELLRVSERTVRRWRAEGTGPPAVRVGKAVRYRRAVDDWLERPDHQVGPPRAAVAW